MQFLHDSTSTGEKHHSNNAQNSSYYKFLYFQIFTNDEFKRNGFNLELKFKTLEPQETHAKDLVKINKQTAGMGSNQFRSYVWDPVMIIGQILTIQCIFYFSLGIWISTSDLIMDSPRSLEQIFSSNVGDKTPR